MSEMVKAMPREELDAIMDRFFGNGSEVLRSMQLAANNINGLSQQMGIVNARLIEQGQRIDRIEERQDKIDAEVTITRNQSSRIRSAIYGRVAQLLKLEYDGGKVADSSVEADARYRGGFISRCYTDARHKSKLGTPYYATLRRDFDEVFDYIRSWEPEVSGGTDGYKRYLDLRRSKREGNG